AGDVLAFALPRHVALLRVVRIRSHRLGEAPVLEELCFKGTDVPSRDALERLGPSKDPITLVHTLSPDTRLFAFVAERIAWQRAGFRKVQTISARAGDEQAALPSIGISWAVLAERLVRRLERQQTPREMNDNYVLRPTAGQRTKACMSLDCRNQATTPFTGHECNGDIRQLASS